MSTPAPAGPTPAEPVPAEIVARLRAAGCVFAEAEAQLLVAAAASPAELSAMVERRASAELSKLS